MRLNVPKSAYEEVGTMDAVVRQKQAEIEVLSEMLLKGQVRFQEVEQRMSEASGSLDNLEGLIRAIEGPNVATNVSMDYDYNPPDRKSDNDDKNEYSTKHYNVALLRRNLMYFLSSGSSQ